MEAGGLDIGGQVREAVRLWDPGSSPPARNIPAFPATQGCPRWPPQLAQGSWAPRGDWGQGLGLGSKGGAETPLHGGAGTGERLGGSRPHTQAHEDPAPNCPGSEHLPSPAHGGHGMWTCMHAHSCTSTHAAARPTPHVHKHTRARTRCSSPTPHVCASTHGHAHAAARPTPHLH